ncbi:MAG TPA: heat-inducible transcriptional repressor HrcA [Acidimicrobiales bacterium]|nr:heat-inducible transcriptional repressor HrcA [Acidimicrobiales bacterium]
MARRVQRKPTKVLMDLDARKATILKAVVVEHIDTAQPVGSSAVAASADLDVSSATVRSEMVTLEREGYLAQPHTSAGRIPTDKGYRYFVDHLQSGVLGAVQQQQVKEFFASVRGEVEEVMEQTSTLLSQMTSYTSVVVGASHAHATILSVQLVNLDAHHHLLVTVFSDGSVLKHSLTPSFAATPKQVMEASRQLNALLINTSLETRVQVPSRRDHEADLVREAVSALHAQQPVMEGEQVFIGGSSRVAELFDGVDTVRQVLAILEQELLVVSLVQDILDQGLSVAIGSEHGFEPLATCALIVAPVTIDGVPAGAVGLLGPTRMKYREAIAAAEVVSERLTRHFAGADDRA